MPSTAAQRARARERAAQAKEAQVRMEQAGAVPPPSDGPTVVDSEPAPSKPSHRVRRQTKTPKPTGVVTPEAQAALHEVVVVAIAGASLFVPEGMRPTSRDVDAIFIPAERIYLRHASVPEISPDATDAIACMMGIAGYIAHVKFPAIQRRQRSRQSAGDPGTAPSGTPGSTPDGTGPPEPDANGTRPDNYAASVLASLHNQTYGVGPDDGQYN